MIEFKMMQQPDDEACGLSCLFALYQHYQIDINYQDMVAQIERSLSGGTIAPLIGKHALEMGFKVTIYTNNLILFDPSWFNQGEVSTEFLVDKLIQQWKCKTDRYLGATHFYLNYLNLGGKVKFQVINVDLLEHYFARKIPILASLNATYLYNAPRDRFDEQGNAISDDIGGSPCGHFLVLYGHDKNEKLIKIADPYPKNPYQSHYYKTEPDRLINAIMLGISTYDGNLLIIEPKLIK